MIAVEIIDISLILFRKILKADSVIIKKHLTNLLEFKGTNKSQKQNSPNTSIKQATYSTSQ